MRRRELERSSLPNTRRINRRAGVVSELVRNAHPAVPLLSASRSWRLQLQEELLDPVLACVFGNLDEPALLEHADRGDVALRHIRGQRARVDEGEEFRAPASRARGPRTLARSS